MSAPRESPAAVRAGLQLSRTKARTSVTSLRRALTSWQEAHAEGRAALSHFSNDQLTLLHLPELSLSKLPSASQLEAAAQRKVKHSMNQHLDALDQAMQELQSAVGQMQGAVAQVAERQAGAAAAALPLFTCLTLAQIHTLIAGIFGQYQVQTEVRIVTPSGSTVS